MHDSEARQFAVRLVLHFCGVIWRGLAFGVFVVAASIQTRREDRDPLLALANVAAEGVPGTQTSDTGSVWSLDRDQEDVGRAVRRQSRGDLEHALPRIATREFFHRGRELVVKGCQPIASVA